MLESNEIIKDYDENHYLVPKALYKRILQTIAEYRAMLGLKQLEEEEEKEKGKQPENE